MEKTLKKLEEVDLVIYLFNAEEGMDEKDFDVLSKIQNKGIKLVVVINKMDKVEKSIFDTFLSKLEYIDHVIPMSIINNEGISELKKTILKIFNKNDLDFEHELIITNIRHKDLLKKSVELLEQAKNAIELSEPIDIISIHVKNATKSLGEIIGADVSIDVVNKIFEKFCLGK